MDAVRVITGTAVALDRSDVDTDQIIPAAWLKRVERTGFGEGLFESWRKDPSFALNDHRYQGASILVAGANFGTGSSREHAVWALMDYGFRAVVSPRFADIFRTNCTKAGLVPAQIDAESVVKLLAAVAADPSIEVTVDVESRVVYSAAAGVEAEFPLDDFTQWRLLEGLDDIGLTLRHQSSIDSFETSRSGWLPTTSSKGHVPDWRT
ncbi:MAG: 3-isopropylmalate/(R)-2-methylmalate dehydratase small subunit [Acidimicrobiaceae bacterium]|jgi:3-isopropylmalate/(R)-2-methylmalate dehydratase small subunit|nr:3-isopropylmalate/(R)-2-methylmalate dehydratase small subunit [Acidimicrobiaceae bacterium]MDQ1446504.1 3-isopropylmalate/(R)-2-methylmalate dehydratase small subunit [Acidimicrobiaceae bacterium]